MATLMGALRRRWWLLLIVVVVAVLVFGSRLSTFYTDVLWFNSIGFGEVFWTRLTTQVGLGVIAGLVIAVLVGGNLWLTKRLAPVYRIPSAQEEGIERYRQVLEPYTRPLLVILAIIVGLFSGLGVVSSWDTVLLWANQAPFGQADPQFGRDLGFFVFELPFLTFVESWLFTALVVTILFTVVGHYLFGGIRPQSPGPKLTPQVHVHLSVLLAILVGVRAWGFYLDRFALSYSERGQVTGLSYTDVNAELVALRLLVVIAAVCAVLFLINLRYRSWVWPAAGVGILALAWVVLSGIYPAVIQRVQVDPEELPREEPFIERNLELTRFGFGIDDEHVTYEQFPANSSLSNQEVAQNRTTLESIRLWNPSTLQNTYRQLQEFRPYYDFRDVDVDRYRVDGERQQVMISAREVNPEDLPDNAQTWQNRRLRYTHGYGQVASAVATKTADGQPQFLASDLPLNGAERLKIANPRVYFGENPPEYSIVKTGQRELDFPVPDGEPNEFVYDGKDGVGVGSPLRRLAFAWRYGEPNIVLSGLIRPESRMLYRRNVRDRVQSVAPYLKLDHDPYPVAVDGRLKYVVDGYTTSQMLPYSERVDLGSRTLAEQTTLVAQQVDGQVVFREETRPLPGISGTANYIRNSVKAVVDAYDGTVTLYVVDQNDPVIQTWQNTFPDSFTPLSEASPQLRRHFRYPEDFFRVQASLFETYHIQDAEQFYTKEDAWAIPRDASFFANQSERDPSTRRQRAMRPYYLLQRLPGEDEQEFGLVQPFTPRERRVMTAYLVGRSDPEEYGQMKVYVMPPNKTVFGPEQVQARIDQDEAVSEQITLWNQSGSRVIYGDQLVVPIEDSLLYAQPLFLRADQSEIPELRKVVLVFGDQVVMRDTLSDGLDALFGDAAPEVSPGGRAQPRPDDGDQPDGQRFDPEAARLITEALQAFAAADEALASGELGTYQQRTNEANNLLEEAQRLLGGQIPAPSPDGELSPSPSPSPGVDGQGGGDSSTEGEGTGDGPGDVTAGGGSA
jgi:uncharacterized membrane protein (UPF0182 family)